MTGGQRDRAETELRYAAEALRDAALLLDAAALVGAASRLYYAVFHAARAALLARGRYAKTHSGQVKVFESTFGATPLLGKLLGNRITADYSPEDFALVDDQVRDLLTEAIRFIERCRGLVAAEEAAQGVDDPDPEPDL